MAWGSRKDVAAPPTSDQIENVLGRSAHVQGDLKAEGAFRIDGTVVGSVESAAADRLTGVSTPVAKKAAKGNIRQPQIFYVRENSRLLHRRRATTGGFAQRTFLSQPKLEVDRRSVVRRRSGFPGTVADVSVPQTMT